MFNVSYAFLRSRKRAAVVLFVAMPFLMSDVILTKLSMVDFPGRKPH